MSQGLPTFVYAIIAVILLIKFYASNCGGGTCG